MQRKFSVYKRRLIRLHKLQARNVKRASRHPYAVPVFVFVGLLILTGAVVFAYSLINKNQQAPPAPKVVIINHDHVEQIVPSIEPTVGKLLAKLHITLHQGDVVEPSLATSINQDDFRINIYRAVPVEIVDGSQKTFTYSAATTARAIATQTGNKLYPEDYVTTVPVNNFVTHLAIGEQVVINRATPVNLNLYGTMVQIRTHASTVAALIQDKHIQIQANDQVIPAPNTPITANMPIFIVRKGEKLASVTQAIAMPVSTVYDNSLAYGTSAVRQQGSAGQEIITYQDQLQNGIVVSSTPIQTVVTVPPVTEIVVEGTNLSGIKGDMALAGIAPSDYFYADYIISHESGWCPTKAQGEHYCPAIPDNPMTPYGYGLCQATPGYKMVSAGSDWATNPITQLSWCNGYAVSHYGGWYNAYEHWINYTWW